MARFDVFVNPGKLRDSVPCVLDVQSDHLAGLATQIVVPLRRRDRFPAVRLPDDLIPVFEIDQMAVMMDIPTLAAVPRSELSKPVSSSAASQSDILAALDRFFWRILSAAVGLADRLCLYAATTNRTIPSSPIVLDNCPL